MDQALTKQSWKLYTRPHQNKREMDVTDQESCKWKDPQQKMRRQTSLCSFTAQSPFSFMGMIFASSQVGLALKTGQ